MTIRKSVDIAAINTDLQAFEEACDAVPDRMFQRAKFFRDTLAFNCDEFLAGIKQQGLEACNCDGIREIECMMFDMVRRKSADTEIEQMIGLGHGLLAADDAGRQRIIANLISSRNAFEALDREEA